MVGYCFLIQLENLCLLILTFRHFAFNVIVTVFKGRIPSCELCSICPICSFPSFPSFNYSISSLLLAHHSHIFWKLLGLEFILYTFNITQSASRQHSTIASVLSGFHSPALPSPFITFVLLSYFTFPFIKNPTVHYHYICSRQLSNNDCYIYLLFKIISRAILFLV